MRRIMRLMFAAITGMAIGAALLFDAIYVHKQYGTALFLLMPFVTGFAATAMLRVGGRATLAESFAMAIGAASGRDR